METIPVGYEVSSYTNDNFPRSRVGQIARSVAITMSIIYSFDYLGVPRYAVYLFHGRHWIPSALQRQPGIVHPCLV